MMKVKKEHLKEVLTKDRKRSSSFEAKNCPSHIFQLLWLENFRKKNFNLLKQLSSFSGPQQVFWKESWKKNKVSISCLIFPISKTQTAELTVKVKTHKWTIEA